MERYRKVFEVAIYSFVFLLLCKALAYITFQIHGHYTSFDYAAKVLMHYGEGVVEILTASLTAYLFLAFALATQGMVLLSWFKNLVALPSIEITGHMLSMSGGVMFGWALITGFENGYNFLYGWKGYLISIICILVSASCVYTKYFMEHRYEVIVNAHGNFIRIASAIFGCIFIYSYYNDFVYNSLKFFGANSAHL